jgi:hypothetical protein
MTAAMQRVLTRWTPKESREIQHPLGTCYVYEKSVGAFAKVTYVALGYAGTSKKSAFHNSHRTEEVRDRQVKEFFAGLESSAKLKADYKAERSKPHTVNVGDIIHHSWGWEQTQCDYYQVLSVTAHGATIQAIDSETVPGSDTGGMSDRRLPIKDQFVRRCGSGPVEEPLKVRIDGRNYVTTLAHGSATVWDGSPKYCSWYA